jgi:ATP-dependent Lon protease
MTEQDDVLDAEVVLPEEGQQAPAVADDVLPDTLYLMPIPNRPFFPGQVQPVAINSQAWGSTLEEVSKTGHGLIGLSYVEQSDPADVDPRKVPEIGCVVRLHRPPMASDQAGQFLAQGVKRFRIVRWLNDKPPYLVQVEYPRSQGDRTAAAQSPLQRGAEAVPGQFQSHPAQYPGGFFSGAHHGFG